MKSPWHTGTYQVRAAQVRAAANANPNTKCWRCGKTLAEHKPGDKWTAGHLIDGQVDGPLLPEAASCNYAAGARLTNTRRTRTELTW